MKTHPSPTDKLAMRAFVQGALYGLADARLHKAVKLHRVIQGHTPDGDYEPHFWIELESGIRLKVTVEVEGDPSKVKPERQQPQPVEYHDHVYEEAEHYG